jgi:hypothetical protein
MIFDDVKFGIDVRDARKACGMTQTMLALKIGYADGSCISTIECALHTDTITVRRYMQLCNALQLHPMHYWTFEDV